MPVDKTKEAAKKSCLTTTYALTPPKTGIQADESKGIRDFFHSLFNIQEPDMKIRNRLLRFTVQTYLSKKRTKRALRVFLTGAAVPEKPAQKYHCLRDYNTRTVRVAILD